MTETQTEPPPPPSVLTGIVPRSYTPDMFADLTGAVVVARALVDGVTTLTFDVHLADDVAADVWWRMTSRDDADEAKRRNLADLRESARVADLATPDGAEVHRAYSVALGDYLLGDH